MTWELIGIIFIILLGGALHFAFELSGENPIVASFSSVNESVWEHLKLAYFPSILFLLIKYPFLRSIANNFVWAKTVGVYLMVGVIPLIFYSYTAFTGTSIFAIDIASFIIAVVVGQLVSYRLLVTRQRKKVWDWIALVFLIVLEVMFVLFTFYPPHLVPFRDPVSGSYGATSGS